MNDDWIPKNEAQYKRTREAAANFRANHEQGSEDTFISQGIHPKVAKAMLGSSLVMAEVLERQCKRYKDIKAEGLKVTLGFYRTDGAQLKQATLRKRNERVLTGPWCDTEDEAIQYVYDEYLRRKEKP